MRARSLRILIPLTATVLVITGCSSSGDNVSEATPAESAAAASSTTTPPTAATVEESTTTSGGAPLVYVAMGDSLGISPDEPDGVIWQYADRLGSHFGVEIDLRNRVVGGLHSTAMLERLRTNEKLRAELAEADVVTTDIPIAWFVEPLKTVGGWQGADPTTCGGDDNEQCLRDALEAYKADADAIIDELVAICGEGTLIRLYDNYMINTGYKIETGTLDIGNPYWKAGMDHVEASASRHGIPVAQVYDAFMGPEGTDDPYTKGLLDDDQLHPNATGAALIADLLDALGYVN